MVRGDVVGGRYRLTDPLASGGMGTVWRARHVELDVDVAVKVMSPALLRASTALARFQREARAAAQLRSPHVVRVFDYGVHEEQPYLAMELLVGEDLRTYLERTGPLPLGRAAQILDALAKALRVAHAAGIVHRDLKPANVFLERSGDDEIVKILDFGIAKELGGPAVDGLKTSTSTVVGSPLYMSPEQVRGAAVDHRTDLWSLATLTYEMVTGRQPFEGASLGDVFARIVADAIPSASSVLPGLPPAVDTFFERAMARSPEARFASATELAAAFRASLGDQAMAMTRVHAPVSAVRVDAPTVGVTPVDAAAARAMAASASTAADEPRPREDTGSGENDGMAEAPTERGEPRWPTSAGARTAPRIGSDEAMALLHTVETDPGPLGQRHPSARSRWPVLAGAGALLALGVAAVVATRPAPTPSPESTSSASGDRPGASAAPDVEPSGPAEAPPPPPPAATPAASVSASPAVATASPAPPAPTAPSPRAPSRPLPTASTSASAPPRATGAIDPIFGVPVGAP